MAPEQTEKDTNRSVEAGKSSADRSFDMDAGHLLPPVDDPERLPLIFTPDSPRAIEWTADRLVAGGLVAFPTDTVYALAASLAHTASLDRLIALKRRPAGKPIPVLLASTASLVLVARDPDPRLEALGAWYWPGPLTVAVPAREGLPPAVVAADGTVGVRVPNHFLALELLERAGGAVAGTSANRGGEAPARSSDEVIAAFDREIDLILDGGVTPGGFASTVVGLDGDELRVLREGPIPGEQLQAAWRQILSEQGDLEDPDP